MRQDEEKTVQKYAKERRSRKRWHRVATCLAAVVVFCTTYALILPAITMEKHCGLTEHTHTDACYTQVTAIEKKVPVCTAERLGIHQHTDTCYDADGKLICGQADYVIHQTDTVVFARFFDIRFTLDGQTLEPAAPVSVTITYAEPVETSEEASCQAIHFGQEGTEILDVTTEQREDGSTSFTHTQNGFSVVGDVVTVLRATNPADVGPNRLPVDYYVCIDGTWTCVGSTKTGWYNNWDGTENWTDYNRDYISVAQAVSILGPYGFTGNEPNPSRVTAYQQKSSNTSIYSDTNTVTVPKESSDGAKILPLSRNPDHAGYNLYYLPKNTNKIGNVASPESLDKAANGFYTVKVFDALGVELKSEVVRTGESFIYDASASDVTSWLVARVGDTVQTITSDENGAIQIENITTPVTISPNPNPDVNAGSHSVTFKVMIDGEWKTVGSLPYYFTGDFDGSNRAYITSAMAAQILGKYGYTADMAPGKHFGYSYNDIYTIYYANGSTKTNFCMDINGGVLEEAQVVQLYTSNGTDAQVFRIWDAGNGYSFITPIGNSAFHVNVYGYDGTTELSGTQLKLAQATNANSQWKVDTGSDGRTTFWSALAPDDQVIDLSQGNISNGGRLQVWHSTGGARYWYLVQQYRISNNTASAQNTNGTYNIGLTTESNGDIVCYYLPAETTNAYSKASESAISKNNSFWSVSVRDDIHSVYSEGDLSTMVQYAPNGGAVTVTIQNADGILWSCQGLDGEAVEAESSQSEGYTTFVIKNITQPVEVVATKTNPTFTVQYYANIDRYLLGNNGNLEVIDTSGKHLPTNSGSQSLLKLTLESIGQTTDQNKGNATSLNRVKSEKRLTQMYTDGTYNFEQHPGLKYFIFNGTHDAGAAANTFAFGNANCETGLGLAQWGGNNINAYNGQNFWMSNGKSEYYGNGVYKGCTFGLVNGLDGNGNLIWDQWITAPHLFNDGTANGKHSYNNGSLQFIQTGDTYTLTTANSSVGSRDNGNEGYIVSGKIETGAIKPASFVNRPYMELPSTGGAGTTSYTAGGLLLITAAAALLYIHNRRRKEDSPSS